MCPMLLIAGIGTAVSAMGSIASGQAAKAQADAQAAADRQQADQTLKQGQYQADRKGEEINQKIGEQTAQIGGSGVTTSGSPSDVVSSTASSGSLDRSAILYGAKVNSDDLRYQGQLAKQQGRNAVTGSYFSAAGNLFSGLGSMAKMYDPNKTMLGQGFGS